MTTPTPADAVRGAVDALRHATDEQIASAAIRAAADALLPRPAAIDRSPQAARRRFERLQFLDLAEELTGNPTPCASQEALAEAREVSQAAAWDGIEPEQVLPAVERLARSVVGAETIEPGPYSEHDLRQAWNAGGDENWDDLQPAEQLAFAQTQAIEVDRRRIEADRRRRAEPAPARLRHCPTHGQQGPGAWGCPECLRELREELATAREALRRLRQWGRLSGGGYSADVVLGVVDWIDGGMTGSLPPLPPQLPSRGRIGVEDILNQTAELLQQRHPAPVAVSERPWDRPGWCNHRGQCWMGDPGGCGFIPSWRLCRPEDAPNMTASLPHDALPLLTTGDNT